MNDEGGNYSYINFAAYLKTEIRGTGKFFMGFNNLY